MALLSPAVVRPQKIVSDLFENVFFRRQKAFIRVP